MKAVFSEERFVSANEGDASGRLALHKLVGSVIEVATAHANHLHIGNPDMEGIGGWVLSRLTIEMEEYPRVDTTFRVFTWIEDFNRHFSLRAFRFEAADGSVLGYARTIWMVINPVTHANVGLSHLSIDPALIHGEKVPIERQKRHRPIVCDYPEQTPGVLTASCPPRQYTFKYCDIDYYRHVNTVRYFVLLLNQFTLDEMDRTMISRFEISFMHEGAYGMTVDILRHDEADQLLTAFTLAPPDNHRNPLVFAVVKRKERTTTI